MIIKSIYPCFLKWLVISTDNSLYIVTKSNNQLVCTFEEDVLKIDNIKHDSCIVYTVLGSYYTSLSSFCCIKQENKRGRLTHIGNIKEWDIFKEKNTKCIFAHNKNTGKHSLMSHTKPHWVITMENETFDLIEADNNGIYVRNSHYMYPCGHIESVKKIQNVSDFVVIHVCAKTGFDILLLFSLKDKKFFHKSFCCLNDFQIINESMLLFYDEYFSIVYSESKSDFHTYDKIYSINDRSVIFHDDDELHVLKHATGTLNKYTINYKIKYVCENQNNELLIVKDNNSLCFV